MFGQLPNLIRSSRHKLKMKQGASHVVGRDRYTDVLGRCLEGVQVRTGHCRLGYGDRGHGTKEEQGAVRPDCAQCRGRLYEFLPYSQALPAVSGYPVSPHPSLQPYGQSGDWSLIFNDEFQGVRPDGTGLDTSKWVTCYWYAEAGGTRGCGDDMAQSWYMPQNAVVSDGSLHLVSRWEPTVGTDGETYPYTSGMITSGRIGASGPAKFAYQYGYAEVRAKVPATKGFWPSFWSLAQAGDYNLLPLPEIDTVEILTYDPNTAYMTYHGPDGATLVPMQYSPPKGQANFSQDYHVFASEWSPGQVIWYIDGVERWRYEDSRIAAVPMYLLLTMGVGKPTSWAGAPDPTTQFPSEFQIDYVRVWQRPAGAAAEPPPPLQVRLVNDLAYYRWQYRAWQARVSAKLSELRSVRGTR